MFDFLSPLSFGSCPHYNDVLPTYLVTVFHNLINPIIDIGDDAFAVATSATKLSPFLTSLSKDSEIR